jgi:hypothetical protein
MHNLSGWTVFCVHRRRKRGRVEYMRPVRIFGIFMALLFTASSSWAASCEIPCALQRLAGDACPGHTMMDASRGTDSGGTHAAADPSAQHVECGMRMDHGSGASSASRRAVEFAPSNPGAPCPSDSALVELGRAPRSLRSISAPFVLAAISLSGSLPRPEISIPYASLQQASAPAYSPPLRTLRI